MALVVLVGCGAVTGDGADDALGGLAPAASYQLINRIDLTAEAVSPAQGELIVSTLRGLATNPARAIVAAAGEAGVPAVDTLYGLLPGPLKDQLEGWINAEIAKVRIDGVPVTDYAGELAGLADLALSHFAVDSELAVSGKQAVHKLTAIDLVPAGLPIRVPITARAGDVLSQAPTFKIGSGGALKVGEQHFGLNYGEYAWLALEAASTAKFGGGIRETLGAAISCPMVAARVAAQCVLTVCVGHAPELTAICEGGLDAIVDLAHSRMAALRVEALHFAAGSATLVDADGDGTADSITQGTWDAELNLGLGLRHAPATFTGVR